MNSTLNLRLQNKLATEIGAVATLRRVADETGSVIHGPRLDVVVPANNDGAANRVAVDPGQWLIEATLPSGETIREQIKVEDGKEVPLTLHAVEKPPHEWLGWQYLLGNVESASALEMLVTAAAAGGAAWTAAKVAQVTVRRAFGDGGWATVAGHIAGFAAGAGVYFAVSYLRGLWNSSPGCNTTMYSASSGPTAKRRGRAFCNHQCRLRPGAIISKVRKRKGFISTALGRRLPRAHVRWRI